MTNVDDLIKRLREPRIVPIPVGETLVIDLKVEPSATDLQAADALQRMKEALEKIANHPTGGVGCNPQGFVRDARRALRGEGT